MARGDQGINQLDNACKLHDIAYSQSNSLQDRHKADHILENSAWSRVKSKDATFGEKTNAWLVTNAMKLKRKLGMGVNKTKTTGATIRKNKIQKRKKTKKQHQYQKKSFKRAVLANLENKDFDNIKQALQAARVVVREAGGRKKIRLPRVLPITSKKTGGFLPLIPLFAGLSALGALGGGAAQIARAVNNAKNAKKALEESQLHNRKMKAIALSNNNNKSGNGLFLKKHRTGYGLYLQKFPKNYR